MLHRLYIGSDNVSGILEIETIKTIVQSRFDGFSIYNGKGIWRGKEEDSCIVEIESEGLGKIHDCIHDLKTTLNQEAIGYVKIPAVMEFI